MTAQQLTASTSTDSQKAFRQALQLKPNSEQQPYGGETKPMPIPEQQPKLSNQQDSASPRATERPRAWGVANSVEPDSQEEKAQGMEQRQQQQQQQQVKRHPHLTVVTDADADATMPPVAAGTDPADAAAGGGGGGGAAIPMSPPSSPTHVVAAHSQDHLVVTTPAHGAATKPADADLPPVVAPSPTSTALPQVAPAAAAGPPARAQAQAAPSAAPIRLGRGRKLCPSCKALTKSAVKQCRECGHVFNPVSQRLRAQHREPKENEEVPVLPRRRHRPSQRLLESLVEPENPPSSSSSSSPSSSTATAGEGGGGQAPSAPARRPLGSASNSGGDRNRRVISTPPAGGPVSREQQPQQLPKRSHKRKNPLPPGAAPPKRKKGAASAARPTEVEQAGGTVDPTTSTPATNRGILPILTLPEQQRVAQDLLASPTPSRHTVPESPELAPMGSPAGPLLFMGSSSGSNLSSGPLEDDSSEWLSRGISIGAGAGGAGSVSPTIAFVEQQLQQQQQQQQQLFAAGGAAGATSLPGLLLDDNDGDQVRQQQQQQQQQQQHALPLRRQDGGGGGGVIHPELSAEGQDRDPFADVEMWWEGGGVAAVVNPTSAPMVTADVSPAFSMVGRDGTMQQRVVFPQNASAGAIHTELLGDSEDALIWNPLRASSAGDAAPGSANNAVGLATAGTGAASAGRTLTLWPGSSNNDNHLLLSASASSSSSSTSFGGPGNDNTSPSPENVVYPNFERGAAIASAIGAPATSPGGVGGGPGLRGQGGRAAEFLLAEASCSSLPEPLVFGSSGTAVAAVSADSCGDGGEGTGFWNPLFPAGGLGSS